MRETKTLTERISLPSLEYKFYKKDNWFVFRLSIDSHKFISEDNIFTRSSAAEGVQFMERNSLLTDLLQYQNNPTVYHIAFVGLLAFVINVPISSYLLEKDLTETLGLSIAAKGFRNFHFALLGWTISYSLCILGFFCCKIWATQKIRGNPNTCKFWNLLWLTALIIYYLFIIIYSSYFVAISNLGEVTTFIFLSENVRLMMKLHSFARNVGSRFWNYKLHSDKNCQNFAFPKLTYFMLYTFFPTLIYKDEYPRTKTIRWNLVFLRTVELFGELWVAAFLIQNYFNIKLQDFGLRKYTLNEIIVYNVESSIAGGLLFGIFFLIILHTFQNLFAEITKFADRRFYEDWWCCTDLTTFYRKWNFLVYQWIHLYIYKDFIKVMPPSAAKLSAILASAVIHEWIEALILRFFLPLNFIMFGFFGFILLPVKFPKRPLINVLFLYLLIFGWGALCTMNVIEFYARRNSPIQNPSFFDYIVPRFLTCDCIVY